MDKGIIESYFHSHAVQISGRRGCSWSAVRNCVGACFTQMNLRHRNIKTPSSNLFEKQCSNYHYTHIQYNVIIFTASNSVKMWLIQSDSKTEEHNYETINGDSQRRS